jgi:cbb3-type cytochrome oxidase subunit 1
VLTKEGIWHSVIKDKYLSHFSVATSFRTINNIARATSQNWKNLEKSVNLITHWLCWNPGSRHSVIVGKDCILGLGNFSFLSPQLLTSLKFNNIRYLYQARGTYRTGFLSVSWKTSDDIGLTSDLALEWDDFCKGLS